MKKIKLLFAAFAAMVGLGVNAQTDVTSTYLTNANFEEGTPMSVSIHTYNKDKTGSNVAQMQAVDNWTIVSNGDARAAGVFTYGDGLFVGGSGYTTPTTNPDGETSGNALGLVAVWSASLQYTQDVTLPAGHYTLTFPVYNSVGGTTNINANLFGFKENGGTTHYATNKTFTVNSWTTMTVSFDLTVSTDGMISLGYTAANSGSGAMPHLFVDKVTITYTDPLKAAKDALQAEIDKAKLCDAKEGLASAISTAEGALASATTTAELEEALATLQAADKDAVLRYENGLADATYSAPVVTDFVVNGMFDDNISGWSRTGDYFQNNQRQTGKDAPFSGGFYENWTPKADNLLNKMYQTIENIPNGTYRLDIAAFVNTLATPNESQYVFANNDKVYLTAGDPTAYEVYTVVTNNQIEVGLEQTTSTANWMAIDNVSLRYYGAGDVINDAKNAAHKLAWEEAKAAAENAIADDAYTNVIGSEKTDLQAEIDKAEPTTAEGYDTATAALNEATAALVAAAPAYTALNTEIDYAKTLDVNTTTAEAALNAEASSTTVTAATQALKVLEYTSINAAYPNDVTSLLGTWSAGNYGTTSGQGYMAGESYFDKWNGSAMDLSSSKTVTLPAGKYVVRVAGRGVTNSTMNLSVKVGEAEAVSTPFLMIGDTGKGIDTSGATNFSDEGTYSNENVGRGWQYRYITFTTDGTADVLIAINGHLNNNWQSFYAPVLLCDNATIDDTFAGETEYNALNTAIENAEAKTLGFEKDQYAPHKNVGALKALVAAKAIDQTAELTNLKTDVVALTTALGNWTANDADVDAIYNGMFAKVAEGQNYPDGWTRTNGWGQMRSEIEGDFTTAYYNQPGSLQYGNQGVYTMPLAGNQAYKLTFSYRSHESNSNHSVTASVLNGEDGLAAVTFSANGSTSEWKTVEALFTTGVAGNYVLTLANSGNTWMTNISLVKVESSVIEINEDADFTPTETSADVTLARTIKADTWNTFVVPFDITNEELKSAFGEDVAVAEFSDEADGDNVQVNFTKMETPAITANKPVLLKGNAGTSFNFTGRFIKEGEAKITGTYVDFVGSYAASTTVEADDYFISGNKLWKSEGSTTLKGTRAYIDARNDAAVRLFIDGEETETAIENVNVNDNDNQAVIYNVAGQRISKMQKGINIVNGKKVLK